MRRGAAVLLALGLLAAGRLGAQEFPPPIDVEAPGASPARAYMTAFVGVLTPLSDLTEDPATFGTAITASGLVGGDVTMWLGRRWGVAVQGVFGPADLQVRATEFQGAVPDDLGEAEVLAGTASVVYRLVPGGAASLLEPYFAAGGGVRRLTVEAIAAPEVEDATDPAATVAAGAYARVSDALAFRIEVRDLISSFQSPATGEARLQNDLWVTVGLAAALR